MILIYLAHISEWIELNYDSNSVRNMNEMINRSFYDEQIIYVGF